MDTLTIAKYKNGYIKISDYNRSVHTQGEIFCPFCNYPLEVTGVQNKFFRALPGRGGHQGHRIVAEYFNSEWEGRKLIETISGNEGEIKITIDLNTLKKDSEGFSNKLITKPNENASSEKVENYARYKTYKKVFRDIVRTVAQMKNLLEKNSIDELGKIKFKYKTGNEELGINEVVILADELNKSLHSKERFVIYLVQSIKVTKGKIYINSYEIGGKSITTSFNYPSEKNKTNIKKDDMIIAFGKISYYEPKDQYYLNTLSDLNVSPIKNEELLLEFNKKEIVQKKVHNNKKEIIKTHSGNSFARINQVNDIVPISMPERKKETIKYSEDYSSALEVSKQDLKQIEPLRKMSPLKKMLKKFGGFLKQS